MRGYADFNFPAFNAAEEVLREAGWEVFNPARKVPDTTLEFWQYMEIDLPAVCRADAVFVLPGWEDSQGATLEVHVAHELEIPVYSFATTAEIQSRQEREAIAVMTGKTITDVVLDESTHLPDSVRIFGTGATRNNDQTEHDYEGFLSPLSIHRFGEYMHEHRLQSDGSIRDSDNWQKGIPLEAYMKSLWRHIKDVWLTHRGYPELAREPLEESLCAILFNAGGMLHETVKARLERERQMDSEDVRFLRESLERVRFETDMRLP